MTSLFQYHYQQFIDHGAKLVVSTPPDIPLVNHYVPSQQLSFLDIPLGEEYQFNGHNYMTLDDALEQLYKYIRTMVEALGTQHDKSCASLLLQSLQTTFHLIHYCHMTLQQGVPWQKSFLFSYIEFLFDHNYRLLMACYQAPLPPLAIDVYLKLINEHPSHQYHLYLLLLKFILEHQPQITTRDPILNHFLGQFDFQAFLDLEVNTHPLQAMISYQLDIAMEQSLKDKQFYLLDTWMSLPLHHLQSQHKLFFQSLYIYKDYPACHLLPFLVQWIDHPIHLALQHLSHPSNHDAIREILQQYKVPIHDSIFLYALLHTPIQLFQLQLDPIPMKQKQQVYTHLVHLTTADNAADLLNHFIKTNAHHILMEGDPSSVLIWLHTALKYHQVQLPLIDMFVTNPHPLYMPVLHLQQYHQDVYQLYDVSKTLHDMEEQMYIYATTTNRLKSLSMCIEAYLLLALQYQFRCHPEYFVQTSSAHLALQLYTPNDYVQLSNVYTVNGSLFDLLLDQFLETPSGDPLGEATTLEVALHLLQVDAIEDVHMSDRLPKVLDFCHYFMDPCVYPLFQHCSTMCLRHCFYPQFVLENHHYPLVQIPDDLPYLISYLYQVDKCSPLYLLQLLVPHLQTAYYIEVQRCLLALLRYMHHHKLKCPFFLRELHTFNSPYWQACLQYYALDNEEMPIEANSQSDMYKVYKYWTMGCVLQMPVRDMPNVYQAYQGILGQATLSLIPK